MTETNAVAIKLPTFWAQQPEVWFLQAEAQFHIRKIKDDTTKYYHVLAALDQETSGRVLDTLSAPPANNKYTNLKQRLLTTFGLSKRERASKLLHLHPLGDRKPSVQTRSAFLNLPMEQQRLTLMKFHYPITHNMI